MSRVSLKTNKHGARLNSQNRSIPLELSPTEPPIASAESPAEGGVGGRSWVLPTVVTIGLGMAYLFFAPNYAWESKEGSTPYGADFLQEWVGGEMVLNGQSAAIYELDQFVARQHDSAITGFHWNSDSYYPACYPPTHYMAFSPFAILPYRWAVLIWLGTLLVSLFGSALLIEAISRRDRGTDGGSYSVLRIAIPAWIGVWLFPAALFSITIGQKSALWLLLLCIAWLLLTKSKDFLAGAVFGLISIKPTLFFLIPLMMLRRGKWSFFLGASTTVCVLWGTALVLLPVESWFGFLEAVKSSTSYAGNGGYRFDWSCNLLSLAYSAPSNMVEWCKQSVCILLAIYALLCCFESRKLATNSPELLLAGLSATFLLSPHAYSYDLVVFLLPILWIGSKEPVRGLAYFAVLAIGNVIAADVYEHLHFPLMPVLLLAILCELRLHHRLHGTSLTVPAIANGVEAGYSESTSEGGGFAAFKASSSV